MLVPKSILLDPAHGSDSFSLPALCWALQAEQDTRPCEVLCTPVEQGGSRVSTWHSQPYHQVSSVAAAAMCLFSPLSVGSLPPSHQQSERKRNILFI